MTLEAGEADLVPHCCNHYGSKRQSGGNPLICRHFDFFFCAAAIFSAICRQYTSAGTQILTVYKTVEASKIRQQSARSHFVENR